MKKEKLSEIGIPSKIEELKKLFPEYFDKEGKFLIEKFKEDIQNQTDISKETYSLEWLGKSYAKVLANEPVRTLLRENKEWNAKNNNSQNFNKR
jgi:adenine-specific DNA-methyltransferase